MRMFKPVCFVIVSESATTRLNIHLPNSIKTFYIYFIIFLSRLYDRRCNFISTTFENNEYFHQKHIRIIRIQNAHMQE